MNSSNQSDHNQAYKDDDGKSQNIDTMLDFNALSYDMSPDLSVVTDRTFKQHPFQKGSYNTGDTAFCILNSGADFIDARNSYLAFDLTCEVDTTKMSIALHKTEVETLDYIDQPLFNRLGSVLDFIQDITITDRAGNEIERVTDVGRLANVLARSTYSPNWFDSYGAQLGFTRTQGNEFTQAEKATHRYPAVMINSVNHPMYAGLTGPKVTGPPRGFAIPMRMLSGLFDFDQLLPAHLMSGLRIEIRFAALVDAIQTGSTIGTERDIGNALTFTIHNPRFVLDSVKLTDSISRELNERAANNGLEIPFRTWWTTKYVGGEGGGTNYNVEVRKAVSRAFRAIAHFQGPEVRGSTSPLQDINVWNTDQNQTSVYEFKEWQWRAGNLYFPHQRMRGNLTPNNLHKGVWPTIGAPPVSSGGSETYMQYQRLFGKNHEKFSENDMHPEMYAPSTISAQRPLPGKQFTSNSNIRPVPPYACLPLDLERSTVQDLSGIPLNNSRILSLNFETVEPTAGVVTVWMQHLKVARVFMDNTEIEE